MAIDLYENGLLTSYIPLEFSFARCNYGCVYCYANSNDNYYKFDANANLEGAIKQLRNNNRKSFAKELLAEGYPVMISNRADPFSDISIKSTETICRYLKINGENCLNQDLQD